MKLRNIFNKNKTELTLGILGFLFTISTTFWFIIGYSELINNTTIGKIIFFSVIAIFFIFKLGNLFTMSLKDVFVKKKK